MIIFGNNLSLFDFYYLLISANLFTENILRRE